MRSRRRHTSANRVDRFRQLEAAKTKQDKALKMFPFLAIQFNSVQFGASSSFNSSCVPIDWRARARLSNNGHLLLLLLLASARKVCARARQQVPIGDNDNDIAIGQKKNGDELQASCNWARSCWAGKLASLPEASA